MLQGMIGMFGGMRIQENPYLPRFKWAQFRKPRSKSKRIQKKWSKREDNFKQVPIRVAYVFNNNIVMHPDDFAVLKNIGE